MARNNCKLQTSFEDGVLVASLEGELDHHGAVAVRTLIDTEILGRQPRKTVIELAGLDFMDSSGIGLIMGRYSLMQRLGGEFVVRNPNERIVKIFKLAGLDRMIRIDGKAPERRKRNEAKGK